MEGWRCGGGSAAGRLVRSGAGGSGGVEVTVVSANKNVFFSFYINFPI